MFGWIEKIYQRLLGRKNGASQRQYSATREPEDLRILRHRPVRSIIDLDLISIRSASWFTPTAAKAIFVYGLSDQTFVKFGYWQGELTSCDEVELNEDFQEVSRLVYADAPFDSRWHRRRIVDVVIPRDVEARFEDEQGLLLDSGYFVFQNTCEPRGASPYVAIPPMNDEKFVGMFRPGRD